MACATEKLGRCLRARPNSVVRGTRLTDWARLSGPGLGRKQRVAARLRFLFMTTCIAPIPANLISSALVPPHRLSPGHQIEFTFVCARGSNSNLVIAETAT